MVVLRASSKISLFEKLPVFHLEGREKSVGLRIGMNAGQVKALRQRQGLGEHLGAADDEQFTFASGAGDLYALIHRGGDNRVAWLKIFIARQND